MINLIGCSKENFFELLKLMQYKHKTTKGKDEDFFTYQPKYVDNKKGKNVKKSKKSSPFYKLAELRFR